MARLTGTVTAGDRPADGAYVQIRNLVGDFQGEVRTDPDGHFTLYPSPGRWRLLAFAPRAEASEQVVEVGATDLTVVLTLA